MNDFKYTLGAVQGHQAGQPFYQATVPLRTLASMLKLDDDRDVNKRSQRLVDENRAKKFSKYLVKNVDGFYVIPPLVGFIDGEFEFTNVPLDGFRGVGKITVSLESRFILFDGQHRAFGIREAMAMEAELGSQTVSIMFFHGLSLDERKQAFHDINFTQKTPAAALCIAYNGRSDFDRMLVDTFSVSHIRDLIEYEKNTVSGVSNKIFSLKTLKDFAIQFNGKELTENTSELISEYTSALFEAINIPAHLTLIELSNSEAIKKGFCPAKHYREKFILPHAVTLKAFGLLGKALMSESPEDWKEKLERLSDKGIFYKTMDHWQGRCINERGKLVSNQYAVRLTYYKLKELCGLPLAPEEKVEEQAFLQRDELLEAS